MKGFSALVKGIQSLQQSERKTIALVDCGLQDRDMKLVGSLIKQSATVEHLEFTDGEISDMGIESIRAALVPAARLYSCFRASATDKRLKSLRLNRNKLNARGAELVGDIVRWTRVERLELVRNNLQAAGACAIADALTWNNAYLEHLDLSANGIDATGAARLAEILARNPGLKTLVLASNPIRNSGAACLADALVQNKHLVELSLARGRVSNLDLLRDLLLQNQTLTHLDLSGNTLRL
ncbi:hypothetical protein HDU91_007040, partial [Kappamyces sp. JEL0680]